MIRLLDKLLFASALLLALQVPQLADHYQQYMAGLHAATKWQVEGYQTTARNFGYPDLETMLVHHEQNHVASVRADAQQKRLTLDNYQELQAGLQLFQQGHLLEKVFYMVQPTQLGQVRQTLVNFQPGLPMSQEGALFGLICAVLINFLVILPFVLFKKWRSSIVKTA